MLKLLEASQYKLSGKVGIKMTFSNVRDSAVKIDPMLIKPLIENVKGTMIDSNYFDGARSNTHTSSFGNRKSKRLRQGRSDRHIRLGRRDCSFG